ncbi:histidine kinase [Bacillus proteolyticus]|uniref:Histidine kinase n=1 Tax=Bacillus proteolyticus TaxID=2026192 RepID=A0AA44KRK2_9BACI|nr:tetratricopeptide repeat protein [Bacillus proteolyticus]OJE37688.1 histidine kinase [Bacillus proteolyticus]PGV65235.1 tetratricopeptide repeat-containing protein [Bacillus cereus]
MNVQIKGNERIIHMLSDLYHEIRKRNITESRNLKKEIDKQIQGIDNDPNVQLYYALLEFRYQYLIDSLSISKDSFNKIEALGKPSDSLLSYYYYFFKAMHSTITGNYISAKELYEEAEKKLLQLPDELEHAEFYFKLSTFSCHKQQYVLALKQVSMAKEIYAKHRDFELNIGYCDNLYGLTCIHLKEYELAEEYLISALDVFKRLGEEHASLYSRHNLAFLYGSQNLSELAIRYISEVNEKSPNNYKALFIEAREHFKLKNKETANTLIEKALTICGELKNEEFYHRLMILKSMNDNLAANEFENIVLKGIEYFNREELYENIEKYEESLALKYYEEGNTLKASEYFYSSSQSRKKAIEREGLK